MIPSARTQKVFVYGTRTADGVPELLVFDSLEERGFEVPKGTVDRGESLEEAVHRELLEESGITGADIVRKLGAIDWHEKRQHFFLIEAPSTLPRAFAHIVTGDGLDAGFHYQFRWLPVDPALYRQLVQGCDRFVGELLAAVNTQ